MMCKAVSGCKENTETGFIFVNRRKFGRTGRLRVKKDPFAENRLANVCLDC